jgi:hypothetical protein
MDIIVKKAQELTTALERYYKRNDESYFPLDTLTVERHITSVKMLIDSRDMSTDARLNRLFAKDELEEPLAQLTNLARALADRDDGHIIR